MTFPAHTVCYTKTWILFLAFAQSIFRVGLFFVCFYLPPTHTSFPLPLSLCRSLSPSLSLRHSLSSYLSLFRSLLDLSSGSAARGITSSIASPRSKGHRKKHAKARYNSGPCFCSIDPSPFRHFSCHRHRHHHHCRRRHRVYPRPSSRPRP